MAILLPKGHVENREILKVGDVRNLKIFKLRTLNWGRKKFKNFYVPNLNFFRLKF